MNDFESLVAGPSTRSVRIVKGCEGDPAYQHVMFYGDVIDIGVDQDGKYVGCVFQGDLFPDEPIFRPGEEKSEFIRKELIQMPVHFLVDQNDRILGIQIIKHRSAKRICDTHPSLATQDERDHIEAQKIKAPKGRWPNSRDVNRHII